MMSFQPTNLKSIIIARRIPLRLSTSKFITLPQGSRFHIKDPLNIIKGLIPFIHTRIRGFKILSQGILYSHSYISQVRDTSLPQLDITYFTLLHIIYHSLKNLGMRLVIFI